MTQSLEDYLETIGNLAQNGNVPRVKDIAENAEKDACLMEHFLSDETLEKIEYCVENAQKQTCALCSESQNAVKKSDKKTD